MTSKYKIWWRRKKCTALQYIKIQAVIKLK